MIVPVALARATFARSDALATLGPRYADGMANRVCHVEYEVTDLERAEHFFKTLFGWTFRTFGDMVVFGDGDDHVGGLTKSDSPRPGATPSIWFDVEDLDGVLAKAADLNAKVLAEKHPLPGIGHSAQIADPDGNPVGLVEFAK